MTIEKRVKAFVELGFYLRQTTLAGAEKFPDLFEKLQLIVNSERNFNSFFIAENISQAIQNIGESLTEENIVKWLKPYNEKLKNVQPAKKIGVVMAGNIPMVGFHDMLCVLIAGHKLQAKLSSDDKRLLPHIAEVLIKIEPEFYQYINFVDRIADIDAIIATGGNNTGRYFEYYFGKYPNIIRKNRNSVAVLTGNETNEELMLLGNDILQYFGLGCRSVSKLYLPEDYDFSVFFEAVEFKKAIIDHHKYNNNYDYNKSIILINKVLHYDNGFLLLKEDPALVSPISVINYEHYSDINSVKEILKANKEQIQCVVASDGIIEDSVPFGSAQCPMLWDYADRIDTLKFLTELN